MKFIYSLLDIAESGQQNNAKPEGEALVTFL